MALFTYSARGMQLEIKSLYFKLGASAGFSHNVSGYASDEFLSIETEEDDWVTEEGADGFVTRSMIVNSVSKISLTLQQTSPTNDLLTRLWACSKGLDKLNAVGMDIFSFNVRTAMQKDLEGLTPPNFSASNCYISKIAPMAYAKESGTRSWEITAVGGVFGADTLASVVQGAGALVRDIGTITNTVLP